MAKSAVKTFKEIVTKSLAIDPILSVILLSSVVLLSVSIVMQAKNTNDISKILSESIKTQLLSTSITAREIIYTDMNKFISFNSRKNILSDSAGYNEILTNLRDLAKNSGAAYIYVIKKIGDQYFVIFDTDEKKENFVYNYTRDITKVRQIAFAGENSMGIISNEYGNFNTVSIPIFKGKNVAGIISVDFEDSYILKTKRVLLRNSILQIIIIVVILVAMLVIICMLVKKVIKAKIELQKIAHYDVITKLPNRQYLMDYLHKKMIVEKGENFAVLFIDLDNFKKVNDNAGHDAGDNLLRKIGNFLQESTVIKISDSSFTSSLSAKTISFRLAAGMLNIAARIGGDEFIHVVRDVATEKDAQLIAENLLEGFGKLRESDEIMRTYDVGLSIGVALYPKHSENYHILIKYADIAMYNAKKNGKNNYAVYSIGMDKDKK